MKSVIFFCFLFVSFFCFSQDNSLKVEYYETVQQNSEIIIKKSGKLYFSKDYTFYKSEFIKTESNGSQKKSDVININNGKNKDFSEILINNKNKTLVERLYENLFLKNYYSVNEAKPQMKWIILNEQKKISNYNCKKAKTTFRGRTYEVWFTEKIPVSSGPWKFSGLPGLILSVEDVEGVYKWEVKSIQYPFKGKEIDFNTIIKDNPKFKKISYKDFDKKRIDAIKAKIELIKSRSANRDGMKFSYEYSTFLEKEPVNEWRAQQDFK
ncbi:GLPGLI family protein [Flavobacterium lacisediminis]|uniref:GLPGLI family protein n=1 Tax=Flavobacterium lacisediminis TaxID=2989705 RepID=A0ABT3EEM3_9FLAO|nr:GLPGLI family protein [Flavobacterium lacisediminis]MCW1147023.1 GLPGLI family protein [Flavobacterium lacisediminis]